MRQEVVRLERYDRQFRYLWANGMTTAENLEQRIAALEREIFNGEQQRKPLYRERRDAEDEAYKTQCSAEIDRQTASLREKRRELALCRRILEDVPLVSRQVQQAEAERREEEMKRRRKSVSTNGETADMVVRESIQITESAVKLAGLGAKEPGGSAGGSSQGQP